MGTSWVWTNSCFMVIINFDSSWLPFQFRRQNCCNLGRARSLIHSLMTSLITPIDSLNGHHNSQERGELDLYRSIFRDHDLNLVLRSLVKKVSIKWREKSCEWCQICSTSFWTETCHRLSWWLCSNLWSKWRVQSWLLAPTGSLQSLVYCILLMLVSIRIHSKSLLQTRMPNQFHQWNMDWHLCLGAIALLKIRNLL